MSARASEINFPFAKRRLVILVFAESVSVYSGMGAPFAVGVPPVHVRTTSASDSASPSARAEAATPDATEQVNAEDGAACRAEASASARK